MHTWWHLARCQASDGFALLLHSHPFPPARFTEIHKVMFGIHRVCHFCCRPKFQRVQTHGQAKLLLQRVLCKRFGNTYIHTGLSEEQVWWFRTQLYIYIYIYIHIYVCNMPQGKASCPSKTFCVVAIDFHLTYRGYDFFQVSVRNN